MTAPKDTKNDKVWTDWLTLTESARQPEQAPRPATNYGRLPVGMAALAAVAIIVAVVGSRIVAPPVGPGGSP